MFYVTTYIYGVHVGLGTPEKNGVLAVLNDNKNLFVNDVNCTTC